MENPFKPEDKVSTKVKGADVEATVVQIFQNEVQVKTSDGKTLWRTMHTVWIPGSAPIPKPAKIGADSRAELPGAQPGNQKPAEPTTASEAAIVESSDGGIGGEGENASAEVALPVVEDAISEPAAVDPTNEAALLTPPTEPQTSCSGDVGKPDPEVKGKRKAGQGKGKRR